MSDSEFAESRQDYQQHAEKVRILQMRFNQSTDLNTRTGIMQEQRSAMQGTEKSYTYLEATYDSLVPGEKRDNRSKMEACKKEFYDLKVDYQKQEQSLQTQRNKEELVYTTTENGANFRAQQNMREKLID